MYQLYIGNKNYSSWSLRPWLLMRALSIPFEERLMTFGEGSNWARFREFSPTGKVPCLHDGQTVVWDSLAITEYFAERHARVWPDGPVARAWARSAAAEMHSGFSQLRNRCTMSCGQRVELHEIGPGLAADVARIDELWSEGLNRFAGEWLAGPDFSAADAFFGPVAFRVQTFGLSLGDTAHAYCERLLGHPAMQAWYAAALAEPWRETAHEREIAALGTVTADYRSDLKAGS
jgi:glutathione S-transferase